MVVVVGGGCFITSCRSSIYYYLSLFKILYFVIEGGGKSFDLDQLVT